MSYDWRAIVGDLEQPLKLRAIPFGMTLFEDTTDVTSAFSKRCHRRSIGGAP